MNGFVCQWDPESRTGQIHACPEDQFFALLGTANPAVADALDEIYPDGFSTSAACPGGPDCVQVTFDPSVDGTARNVRIVSRPAANALQLAQRASMHAVAATQHADALGIEGVQPKTLAAVHAAAATAHSAAASALAAALQQQTKSSGPSEDIRRPGPKSSKGKNRR